MDKKRRLEEINHLKIFSGNANPALARNICEHLSIQLGNAYVGRFPDGEIDLKVNEDVRGADVFLVQPTCPPVNENLTELLIFIDCLKRASAARITAVLPYYGYARKDRKDEGRVPITAKLVANIITEAGADRVLTVDLHAAQIQGFFDIPVDHLLAFPVISKYFERLAWMPVPGKCMTPIGRTASIASLRLNGAAFACFVQSGLKAICGTLRLLAHLAAISSAPFGEPPCSNTMSGCLAWTLSSRSQIRR